MNLIAVHWTIEIHNARTITFHHVSLIDLDTFRKAFLVPIKSAGMSIDSPSSEIADDCVIQSIHSSQLPRFFLQILR